jgi:hypothetical protein
MLAPVSFSSAKFMTASCMLRVGQGLNCSTFVTGKTEVVVPALFNLPELLPTLFGLHGSSRSFLVNLIPNYDPSTTPLLMFVGILVCKMVSGQINLDQDRLQASNIPISSKSDNFLYWV